MTIRPMTLDDVTACVELYLDVVSRPPWNETWPADLARERVAWPLTLPCGVGLVALDDDGSYIAMLTGYIDVWQSGKQCHVYELEVRPDRQGGGIGKAMLAALDEHLQAIGGKYVCLITDRNTPAEGFYRHLGFRPTDNLVFLSKSIEPSDASR